MKKHFVEFHSPGTVFPETTVKPIDSWDAAEAEKMAATVTERFNATPYGFRFLTRERTDADLDSKVVKQSGMYFIRGRVETIDDVKRRADPKESILLSNMEYNGWNRIVRHVPGDEGWGWTLPLEEGDAILHEA
jgi:hypothetical protein